MIGSFHPPACAVGSQMRGNAREPVTDVAVMQNDAAIYDCALSTADVARHYWAARRS